MRNGKSILAVLTLVMFAAVLLSGCGANETAEETTEKTIPVEVEKAYRGELQINNTYQGNVLPKKEVKIVPKVNGQVEQLNITVGDKIETGDVLARLDAGELADRFAQAEAGYRAAQAQLEKIKAGTRPEQLEQLKAGVVQAEAGVKNAENSLTTAQTNYERMQHLYEQGGISLQQFEQAKDGLESAETGLETAKAQLKNAEEALRMAQNGAIPEDIKAAEAQAAQAKAALELARTQLDNAVITAPISGVISSLTVEQGEMASAGMQLAVINQLETVEVDIALTEKDVNRIELGREVEVLVTAASADLFQGTVVSINPVANPQTKTYQMKVELDNGEGLLKAGMSAEVEVEIDSQEDVVLVPVDAVVTDSGEEVVFVVDAGAAKKREIETGLDNGEQIAVLKGISPGEQVVTSGRYSLEDGAKVKVINGGEQ